MYKLSHSESEITFSSICTNLSHILFSDSHGAFCLPEMFFLFNCRNSHPVGILATQKATQSLDDDKVTDAVSSRLYAYIYF